MDHLSLKRFLEDVFSLKSLSEINIPNIFSQKPDYLTDSGWEVTFFSHHQIAVQCIDGEGEEEIKKVLYMVLDKLYVDWLEYELVENDGFLDRKYRKKDSHYEGLIISVISTEILIGMHYTHVF